MAEQLLLASEAGEIGTAPMIARMKPPDIKVKYIPEHHPIPDHILRMEQELT